MQQITLGETLLYTSEAGWNGRTESLAWCRSSWAKVGEQKYFVRGNIVCSRASREAHAVLVIWLNNFDTKAIFKYLCMALSWMHNFVPEDLFLYKITGVIFCLWWWWKNCLRDCPPKKGRVRRPADFQWSQVSPFLCVQAALWIWSEWDELRT